MRVRAPRPRRRHNRGSFDRLVVVEVPANLVGVLELARRSSGRLGIQGMNQSVSLTGRGPRVSAA
jgi:hypothetical protein